LHTISVKPLNTSPNMREARGGIGSWFRFYNDQRFHQSWRTPAAVFHAGPRNRKQSRARCLSYFGDRANQNSIAASAGLLFTWGAR
jgi:hypothetical protein